MGEEQQDKGVARCAGRSGGRSDPNPQAVSAVPAPAANAIDRARDRLHKFAVEWKVMERRSGYTFTVCELHAGDPRHAGCDISDIITLLEAVDVQTPPEDSSHVQ